MPGWFAVDVVKRFNKYDCNSNILIVTVTLKIVNQSFCLTLKLIMKQHRSRFACKRFSRSEYIVRRTFIEMFYLYCDRDLEHSNPVFSQNRPAHDGVPPYYVFLQKDQQLKRYSRNGRILIYEPSLWPWPWRLANRFFFFFLPDTRARDYAPPFRGRSQKAERFRSYRPDRTRTH